MEGDWMNILSHSSGQIRIFTSSLATAQAFSAVLCSNFNVNKMPSRSDKAASTASYLLICVAAASLAVASFSSSLSSSGALEGSWQHLLQQIRTWTCIEHKLKFQTVFQQFSITKNQVNLCLVFLIPAPCHSLSPSLSAALVVSIIHHLHSQAIYTSFYSESAFTHCWLHLSTPIQIFRPVCAVLSLHVTSGSEKCIHWLPYINKRAPNKYRTLQC